MFLLTGIFYISSILAKGGTNYMELGLFIVIGYVAWKIFLKDLLDEGIHKVKRAFPAEAITTNELGYSC